jgi:PAS domain S-box-containing protein
MKPSSKKVTQEGPDLSGERYQSLLEFVPDPIVIFSMDGLVRYLNSAFTETFGWIIEELKGKHIPFVPEDLKGQTREAVKELLNKKGTLQVESKRLTKDGRLLDVLVRGIVYSESGGKPDGELLILRDITHEKRLAQTKETLLCISMALPQYPELEDLLDYITSEIKKFLNVEGAMIALLDIEKNELYFLGGAYENKASQKKAREMRFSADKGVVGRVIKTGEPTIVSDTSRDPDFYDTVDKEIWGNTYNILDVPLRSGERIIGVLGAVNKKSGFDETDVELMKMIASTVELSVENARFAKEIKKAYKEMASLNRAKDRVINHLSHELKTPVAVLLSSLHLLEKKFSSLPEASWKPTIMRANRNLERILDIQYQVQDIMLEKQYKPYGLLNLLLEECADELTALVAEEAGEGPIIERLKNQIESTFGPKEIKAVAVTLDQYLPERFNKLKPQFTHRNVDVKINIASTPQIHIPIEVLNKVFDGLLKNAIEATPDEGKIEIIIAPKGQGVELIVSDYGVGIIAENQSRIFEGFFTTQETMLYSSKRPFDFNAGGKGADLLRMKIFSERHHFKIEMQSMRCRFISRDIDLCPGRISSCRFCNNQNDCLSSGGTTFSVFFLPESEKFRKEDQLTDFQGRFDKVHLFE